jgi:hypothetical protein
LNAIGGVVAILLVWLGAALIGKEFFGPYFLWPVAILGWIGTIWIIKNTKS